MLLIRPARASDAEVVLKILTDSFTPYLERMDRKPAPMLADYASHIAAGEVWVAEAESQVLGMLGLIPEADHLLLDVVAVSPTVQGQGNGKLLLKFTDEHARALGLDEVRLFTNEVMTENLTYYPRHGFVETHRAVDGEHRRDFFSKRL
ncbi:GNAT family N-acetyltransferase [Gulosibacter chungangensis]|uniref:GNAT family N-acetyltransferase n=1 Tax=Gulosibacter chungangensis TaxID=979746 RepID=A0A7J5BCB3_9MICO|nr:GNAT family N-acetyltransferase [Gulosibacter chungangensis]KAB1642581.1 GNAT family N-acetyltransferase [Gulosibacter chungangensis]